MTVGLIDAPESLAASRFPILCEGLSIRTCNNQVGRIWTYPPMNAEHCKQHAYAKIGFIGIYTQDPSKCYF